jgi:hypothetical protein
MGARYTTSKTGVAMVVGSDLLTITAPATRALKIWAIRLYGEGTASASNRVTLMRSTVGTTPVAGTSVPKATLSAASGVTVATGWTTQPTAGVVIHRIGINSNGAYVPFVAVPGMGNEIDIPPSGQVSLRCESGTGIVTPEIEFEEVG